MYGKQLLIFLLCGFVACNANVKKENNIATAGTTTPISTYYSAINQIPVPEGFPREKYDNGTFAAWLQHLPLKKDKTVYLYNGKKKLNQRAQYAVLDISTGDKDLQQCADAAMRLRAEYLFSRKEYNKIVFSDNEGTRYLFTAPFNRNHFDRYLQKVFGMCGSASLEKQLNAVRNFNDIEAGDIIIKGGFPGHAVMVMDIAVNSKGEKMYLLAQSYMPAQDIHVLINPDDASLSPWYSVKDKEEINTPEYNFTKKNLKRW